MADQGNRLFAASVYVSSYKNSLARVCSKSGRGELGGARHVMEKQITGIAKMMESRANDVSLLVPSARICREYYDYYDSLIRRIYPNQLAACEGKTLDLHPLYIASSFGRTAIVGVIDAYEASLSGDRISAFLERVLVSRKIFDDVISGLGINEFSADKSRIVRVINFQPEQRQAGISVLSFFGEIVSRKYPDMDVGVRIEQNGNTVKLVIETPDGGTEVIERELENYGMVVTGKINPEEFLDRREDVLLLKNKLEMANLELRQTREIMALEREGYAKRIDSLEDQVGFLRKILIKKDYQEEALLIALKEIALASTVKVAESLDSVIEILSSKVMGSDEAIASLQNELSSISKSSPGVIDKLNELILKGSIQGAAGNYLYAALNAIQRLA